VYRKDLTIKETESSVPVADVQISPSENSTSIKGSESTIEQVCFHNDYVLSHLEF
jgi:hypothetical protein